MKKIKIWNDNPSDSQISEITESLSLGKIVILPTDTLYGLACDALQPKAIERICRIKGINPEKNNLSIICSDISMAAEYARIDNLAFKVLKELTPGPFTFLFHSSSSLPKAFKGRKTVGVRIPDNNLCRRIAKSLGHPILTTSIDFSDDDYAINPDLISETYDGLADMMAEGDEGGLVASTIIDFTNGTPEVTRQGKGEVDF